MTSGVIYIIKSLIDSRVYIGLTNNYNRRINEHKNNLRKGVHKNPKLQAFFDKYGECYLEYSIIEYCKKDVLKIREEYWVKYFNSCDNGFNCTYGGDDNPMHNKEIVKKFIGAKNPMFGRKRPELSGENNPYRKMIAAGYKPKRKILLTEHQIIEFKKRGLTQKEIAKIAKCSQGHISEILLANGMRKFKRR